MVSFYVYESSIDNIDKQKDYTPFKLHYVYVLARMSLRYSESAVSFDKLFTAVINHEHHGTNLQI